MVLWDLSRDPAKGEDPQAAKSDALGEARHREPVVAMVRERASPVLALLL